MLPDVISEGDEFLIKVKACKESGGAGDYPVAAIDAVDMQNHKSLTGLFQVLSFEFKDPRP